ncbi:hypothetical protein CUJ83_02945 [Methanocella sp. CWC-04]|uniref:UspA domain-containing protein n=1 Tax=Methanooceanicella nereidis TaxID=2052831 RepID=A0AAP2W549_9EURY|nr:universal stress protein [Methanocella sp. CWC-04]MCD1293953.1 hypothetical protein [Methanocella sp. CWC-04]
MFEKILYAIDFSEHSQKMLECLCEIPGAKEVILLHVIDSKTLGYWEYKEIDNIKVREAELLINEKKKDLESLGLKVDVKVAIGIPSKEILRMADEECVSLIVMGAKGMSLIKGLLLGSVSSEVMRYCKTNLLIMRYRVIENIDGELYEKFCERTFSRVLYSIDERTRAEAMADLVKMMPKADEAILAYIVDRGETGAEIESLVTSGKNKLDAIKEMLDNIIPVIDCHVHIGEPAKEISRVAEEEDVSLILIDSRPYDNGEGRTGTVVDNIVRYAKRPVMMIKFL